MGLVGLAEPRRRHARYSWFYRFRAFLLVPTIILVGVLVISIATVLFRDIRNDSDGLPRLAAPSREELDRAIELAERYVLAQYKPLTEDTAVQSEASGVPFRVHLLSSDKWILLGEEVDVCPNGECQRSTSINPHNSQELDESYTVSFNTQEEQPALAVTVQINWAYTADSYRLSLSPLRVTEPAELWLDRFKLATYTPEASQPSAVDVPNDAAWSRSLRYTVRHATQTAYLYWRTYGNDPQRAAALATFLERNGFKPGYDMRAPMFDAAAGLPDDLPFNDSAYPDCDRDAPSSELAYAYRSKVCLDKRGLDVLEVYQFLGGRDPFLQAWQALHTLLKYRDPNHEHPLSGLWLQGDTPAEIARHLRGHWNNTGFGIPKCTPFNCLEMSGIRNSVFGMLMTELGIRYGDKEATLFADAAAQMAVRAQVKEDGYINKKEGRYYRPTQIGAFLAAWDTEDARYVVPSIPRLAAYAAYKYTDEEPIPPEYLGVQVSNSETTFDALVFLIRYRCAKYGEGCMTGHGTVPVR